MQIDFERDRGLLGLPPKAPLLPRPVKAVLGALLVLLLAVALGAILQAVAGLREADGEKSLQVQLHKAHDPDEIRRLALLIREQAPDTVDGKMQAAAALEFAGEALPDQSLWQQETLANYRAARALLPKDESRKGNVRMLTDAHLGMLISGLLLDLGLDKEAKAEVESIKTKYETQEFWGDLEDNDTNLTAYILSSAQDPQVRNGAEALKLMTPMMEEYDYNREVGAYLDTYAECNYAAGRPHRAVELQKQALTRAESRDLWVYIKHFRAYQAAADKIPADPPLPAKSGSEAGKAPGAAATPTR